MSPGSLQERDGVFVHAGSRRLAHRLHFERLREVLARAPRPRSGGPSSAVAADVEDSAAAESVVEQPAFGVPAARGN